MTGAYSFTGRYIAERLLARGTRVRTLTGQPSDGRIEACPLNFNYPEALAESLRGATTLFNTYWMRFGPYHRAVRNIETLVRAAERAGVETIVHLSVTKAREGLQWPYFKGKVEAEEVVMASTMTHCIIRPTVIFGERDALINNIAWLIRHLPVFGVAGDGRYRIQPVYVGDVADLAVEAASLSRNAVMDAAGPETYNYDDFICAIGRAVGRDRPMLYLPVPAVMLMTAVLNRLVGDTIVFRQELEAVMASLHTSDEPPTGRTRFGDWLREKGDRLGRHYESEMARHYR